MLLLLIMILLLLLVLGRSGLLYIVCECTLILYVCAKNRFSSHCILPLWEYIDKENVGPSEVRVLPLGIADEM